MKYASTGEFIAIDSVMFGADTNIEDMSEEKPLRMEVTGEEMEAVLSIRRLQRKLSAYEVRATPSMLVITNRAEFNIIRDHRRRLVSPLSGGGASNEKEKV